MKDASVRNSLSFAAVRSGAAHGAIALALGYAACAAPAIAQSSDAAAIEQDPNEIVVTGTLIRGVAPTGTQSLNYGRDDLERIGAADTSQLLAAIPQDNNFNSRPAVGGLGSFQTVNRPTLRYLGGTSAGGSSTLVLVDGHRLPGMGILQTSPDIDAIAPGAIERIEIVTDGGSSTYGADAVGGVINFITRKRFDGLEVKGHYGFADDYWQWDASATAGKTWDRGSVWLSYNYAEHDFLFARDRDYVRKLDYTLGVPADLTCSPGNVVAGTTVYALPSLTAGLGNRCDTSRNFTLFPESRRHSAFAGLNVELSDAVTFDARGFYMNRVSRTDDGPRVASVGLNPTVDLSAFVGFPLVFPNPYYRSVGGTNAGQPETVFFDFSPVFGAHNYSRTQTESWGMTDTLTAKLGGDWQATGFFNYGQSRATFKNLTLDQLALGTAAFLGQFDPFNLANPANAAVLAQQQSYTGYSVGRNWLTNARAVVDGPLFTLPGGEVRMAAGAEFMREEYALKTGQALAADLASIPTNRSDRTTKALFGEVSVPVFGDGNRVGGLYALTLSASARYDHYSDFGNTFNPKLGASWLPVDWWTIRGSWGKSFQAPSLSDNGAANPAMIADTLSVPFGNPSVASLPGQTQLVLIGGGAGLKPQKATTWSVGTDIKPPLVPGLVLNLTYYNVDFSGRIGTPPFFDTGTFYSQFPQYYKIYNQAGGITGQDIVAFAALANNPNVALQYAGTPGRIYSLIDARSVNLSRVKTSGLDFGVNYQGQVGAASLFGGINGSYILTYKLQPFAGASIVNSVETSPRVRLSTNVGAQIGPVRAQATWQRTGGLDVTPSAVNLQQSHIASFNTVNLDLRYDIGSEGLTKGLAVTLNIDNVFDQDPPTYRGASPSNGNGFYGFTLGRLVQFGVEKKF
jgi:iron complex outermembrane receptor protein